MVLSKLDDLVNANEEKKVLEAFRKSGLTYKEFSHIARTANNGSNDHAVRTYTMPSSGKTIKFGVISDTHIGHKTFDEGLLAYASKVFKAEGIKNIYHVGDITEGMSGRPGHIYELAQIGFSQQVGEVERLFKKYLKDFQIYAITGNHDQWYTIKNNAGLDVGEELQARLRNFHYLGENEADIKLAPRVRMKLFHPNDGTAYADSYKLQKLTESFGGGEKPNIIFEGHYHKAIYMFRRNIHCFESGTLCGQSWFMRGKKLPAHKGFYVIEMKVGKRGIETLKPTFYPAYD